MKKKPMHVMLDDDLTEWLRQEAVRRKCSVSQVLRTLIVDAMGK